MPYGVYVLYVLRTLGLKIVDAYVQYNTLHSTCTCTYIQSVNKRGGGGIAEKENTSSF